MVLTSDAVTELTDLCLKRPGESDQDVIAIEGFNSDFFFSGTRIRENAGRIAELAADLPDRFRKAPDGAPVAEAWDDRSGRCWTTDRRQQERLACLAIAAGAAVWRRGPRRTPALPNLLVLVR